MRFLSGGGQVGLGRGHEQRPTMPAVRAYPKGEAVVVTCNRTAARGSGQPFSGTQRAARRRPVSVHGAYGEPRRPPRCVAALPDSSHFTRRSSLGRLATSSASFTVNSRGPTVDLGGSETYSAEVSCAETGYASADVTVFATHDSIWGSGLRLLDSTLGDGYLLGQNL